MKHQLVASGIALLTVFASACENLSPGENAAVFGTAAGLATAIPMSIAGVDSRITAPVALGSAAIAAGGAYVIAKHQASERQRKIAEQRARIYLAEQEAARAKAKKAGTKSKKTSRYIAVKTVKEKSSTSGSQVMIFDTKSEKVVGNNVYDLKSSPKVGETSKFDTYTAQYVGSGS